MQLTFKGPTSSRRGASNSRKLAISLYDTLLALLQECDAAGRVEIFRLLLERRCSIPQILPNGEQHLPLLKLVHKDVGGDVKVCLGEDVALMRVAIISCREKHQSQTTELLKEIFHIESLHREDLSNGSTTAQPTTAELGLGFVKEHVIDHVPDCRDGDECECPEKDEYRHCLVLHIVGDFRPLWDLVNEFSEYLIVEDTTNESRTFHKSYLQKNTTMQMSKNLKVVVWTPSTEALKVERPNSESASNIHKNFLSPVGPQLYKAVSEDLARFRVKGEKTALHQMKLPEQLQDVLKVSDDTFDGITKAVNGLADFENLREKVFVLQKSFSKQHELQGRINEHRNDDSRTSELNKEIIEQSQYRRERAAEVRNHSLVKLVNKLLKIKDQSKRILAFRHLELSLAMKSDSVLQELRSDIDKTASDLNQLKANGNDDDVKNAQRSFKEAKNRYNMAVVGPEHIWREMSHMYEANNGNYKSHPKRAAQHLIDGLCLELMDGDSNAINLPWIKATLKELHKLLKAKRTDDQDPRIFVLSIMGVQSSGKSTILNIMFGIQMKTSVGQCTRGINMQLVPVADRKEYDYILLLDTEGTRAPEYWGLDGSEKRDNRMATISILLADATIVVNPGENDAAVKEILPMVLLAYQDSKLAEEKGGQMSSRLFFVYNKMDTQQQNKLNNIVRSLSTSLKEAFIQVNKMSGSREEQELFRIFPRFKVDASNPKESDVRIFGDTLKSFNPPDDVPDSYYGESIAEFRQHIHDRTTGGCAGSTRWNSRTLREFWKYVSLVWKCITSADFTLNFANVVQRATYDKMNNEIKECEKELGEQHFSEFASIEEEILRHKVDPKKANDVHLEDFPRNFAEIIQTKIDVMDERVKSILDQQGREKWKDQYHGYWEMYKKRAVHSLERATGSIHRLSLEIQLIGRQVEEDSSNVRSRK